MVKKTKLEPEIPLRAGPQWAITLVQLLKIRAQESIHWQSFCSLDSKLKSKNKDNSTNAQLKRPGSGSGEAQKFQSVALIALIFATG